MKVRLSYSIDVIIEQDIDISEEEYDMLQEAHKDHLTQEDYPKAFNFLKDKYPIDLSNVGLDPDMGRDFFEVHKIREK